MAEKILIVEEDHIIHESFIQGLEGFDTRSAYNGEEAVEIAKNYKPAIVLMDIHLGNGINGINAAAQIQEQNQDTKIIYITGDSSKDTLDKIIEKTGNAQVLYKPTDIKDIEKVIENKSYQLAKHI
jgi:ActR/RegA family two-component response regulator